MKQKKQAISIITALCVFLGILMGLQFKAVKKTAQAEGVQQQRVSQLLIDLRHSKEEVISLEKKLREVNQKLHEYENSSSQNSKWAEIMQKDLDVARMMSGSIELQGPGITVILDDNKVAAQKADNDKVDPNIFLIHDEDILKVVNELKAAGAEAISVNNQRIVANSAIRCVGPVITINDVRLAPPFEIKAIGDPATLEGGLKLPQGIIDNLTFWGVQVTIKKSTDLHLPSFKENTNYKYAKAIKKEGE